MKEDVIQMPSNGRQSREWPTEDCSRIPNWVYSDPDNYQRELERIFYGPFWTFVGLECEVPNPGDWKMAVIGEREVLLTRSKDGSLHVLLNSCAHRAAQVCAGKFGHAKTLVCPYHQWAYDMSGQLIGVPFRRGMKGKGGFPEDFDPKQHGMRRLKVDTLNGAVYASFDERTLPLKDYYGPELYARMTRVLDGRPLKVLGYQRQRVRGNWKLYPENLRDAYHATLLHVFLISFGLYRIDQKGELLEDERTLAHHVTSSRANDRRDVEGTEQLRSLKPDFELNDMRVVDTVKEFADDVTIQNISIFPALTMQQQQNLLQFRNIIPRGPNEFEISWTYFGYADDSEEMTQRRLRLANLTGAAGFISVDDTEVFEMSGNGMRPNGDRQCVVELGGREPGSPKEFGNMVSEGPIRSYYAFYRQVMYGDMASGSQDS